MPAIMLAGGVSHRFSRFLQKITFQYIYRYWYIIKTTFSQYAVEGGEMPAIMLAGGVSHRFSRFLQKITIQYIYQYRYIVKTTFSQYARARDAGHNARGWCVTQVQPLPTKNNYSVHIPVPVYNKDDV
jgi:hypothetical protein